MQRYIISITYPTIGRFKFSKNGTSHPLIGKSVIVQPGNFASSKEING